MADNKPNRGLGRGLSSLLADANLNEPVAQRAAQRNPETLPIEYLVRNIAQPRQNFDEEELKALAESIGEKGIIQPIIVKRIDDEKYMIIAGERRWRAASMARLHKVPVIIRDFNEQEVAEIALIENIQRADLSPIEEAMGYQSLMEKYGHTQESLSKNLGKSRSHIANMVRILKLDPEIREMIERGDLSFGHAKVLLASDQPLKDAKRVFETNMSVRELERSIESRRGGGATGGKIEKKSAVNTLVDADTRQIESELRANIGMSVKIQHNDSGKGKMTISYDDLDQLDRICQLLGR